MPLAPPPHIAELLDSLGAASPGRIRRAGRWVRRLGRQLPQFDSVWADALAQYGVLTRWQAAEICAGRGRQLKLGPYAVIEPLTDCLYAQAYRARHVDSGQPVRLIVASRSGREAREAGARLRTLAEAAGGLRTNYAAMPMAAGQVDQEQEMLALPAGAATDRPASAVRLWVAAEWTPGRSAADWLVAHGRMPAAAVLEIAREMAAGLAQLESAGLCHGDIATTGLWLCADGRIQMPLPGVRGVLRPEEGYALADLPPEAFDYLAPERVAHGEPPNLASDLYACGCVWWHLLCGRAPLAGGDSLCKLRAAHEARIPDPRQLAPDTPASFAEVLLACVRPEPDRRPRSAAELVSLIGPTTTHGHRQSRRVLRTAENPRLGWPAMRAPASLRSPRRLLQPAALGLALAASLLVAAWPVWRAVRDQDVGPGTSGRIALHTDLAPRPGNAPRPSSTTARRDSAAADRADQGTANRGAMDRDVLPTAYLAGAEQDAAPPRSTASRKPSFGDGLPSQTTAKPSGGEAGDDMRLASDQLEGLTELKVQPGQRVGGQDQARVRLHVPAAGLRIIGGGTNAGQPVRFEAIDFVWEHAGGPETAMVLVEIEPVEFQGCTFQTRSADGLPPVAVRWSPAPSPQAEALTLPSGSIRFSDCQFLGTAAAIECRLPGVIRIELANVLHLGPGPLVHTPHGLGADDSLNLALEQVTLRGASSLWRCPTPSSAVAVGRVLIRATHSVFAPAEGGSLIAFHGDGNPMPILHNLTWEGEGALVTPGASVAAQERPGSRAERLDDRGVPMDGLVLSQVEFASPGSGAADSRLLRWSAPLRTADAPGCDPDRLPPIVP